MLHHMWIMWHLNSCVQGQNDAQEVRFARLVAQQWQLQALHCAGSKESDKGEMQVLRKSVWHRCHERVSTEMSHEMCKRWCEPEGSSNNPMRNYLLPCVNERAVNLVQSLSSDLDNVYNMHNLVIDAEILGTLKVITCCYSWLFVIKCSRGLQNVFELEKVWFLDSS